MLVRRVDLSHTNLVRTRAGMLVGGVMLIHSMLIKRVDCIEQNLENKATFFNCLQRVVVVTNSPRR